MRVQGALFQNQSWLTVGPRLAYEEKFRTHEEGSEDTGLCDCKSMQSVEIRPLEQARWAETFKDWTFANYPEASRREENVEVYVEITNGHQRGQGQSE
ncbi:hypothetical protein A0H81_11289 [Grifola frondosa]|uniref:Uncharacterized protein n=1 Tax=Grifola frondosa TaxID=5627 RepID=A0A1C7LWG7_GRIFR|nr:hypothetical protein A0H81_11289 [Grifola frondosa]